MKLSTWLLAATIILAASCSSTKHVAGNNKSNDKSATMTPADVYKQKVVANSSAEKSLVAKMKVNLGIGDKNVSLSGNLKMKRGDVIQLSMSFPIVGEVCRMEFTRDGVLVIDRINSRYVRATYDQVDFLRSANLDFNVLESVFWNEVFYPGSSDVRSHLGEFSVSSAGNHTLLNLTSAPKLDYAFLTLSESALLDRTTVSSKNINDRSNLTCIYGDFAKFGAGKFPTHIQLNFAGDTQTYALDMSLNSLTNSTDWKTRTEVSDKYKQIDPEKLFRSIIP